MPVFALLCLLALTRAAVGSWPPSDFAYWWWQTSLVVGNWLYIDSGEYYALDNNYITVHALNYTLSINLSQSWTIGTADVSVIPKPTGMTQVRRPYMWYEPAENIVYERGGWAYSSGSYSLWSFQPDGQGGADWQPAASNSIAEQYTSTFGSAFTASDANFYSLGGAISGSIGTPVQGLLTYDFATSAWNNASSGGATPNGYSVQSEAVFMPNFGNAGLLAILGGDSPYNQSYYYEQGVSLVDLSNITIYDPDSGTWYHQTATGSVPPPRSEFCAVGSAPADNGTYEIYIFGGSTNQTFDVPNATDTGYLDVFVLSIPAFTWFQINAPSNVRRSNHFCQVMGDQMLIMGGRDPSYNGTSGLAWETVDPWTWGMMFFNMTAWAWTGSYSPNATYQRPALVQQHYATQPNNTVWSDPALAALFVAKPPSATTGVSTGSPSSGSASASASAGPTHHSDTGAIVGGVVGGVGGLAIVGAIIFFCLSRRRRRHQTERERASAAPAHEIGDNDQKYELENPPAEMEQYPVELPTGQAPPKQPLHVDTSGDHQIGRKPIQYA